MTDNNADETDGQNSKLSRRAAVALLGTSAVGGTVATGAFSQLTADRPIDVEVVGSGGDSELGAGNTTSRLRITNNHNERINATISTNDLANVSVSGLNTTDVSLNGTQSANLTSSSNGWELTGLRPGSTTEIEFEQNETSTTTPVGFDVEAFSGTNGYTIGSDQAVEVRNPPASGVARWTLDSYNTDGSTIIDVWGNYDGTTADENLGSNPGGPTSGVTGANYTGEAYDFDGSGDYIDLGTGLSDKFTSSDEITLSAWINVDNYDSTDSISIVTNSFEPSQTDVFFTLGHKKGGWETGFYDGIWNRVNLTTNSPTGSWVHLTGMFEVRSNSDNVVRLYVNGSQEGSNTFSKSLPSPTDAWEIGRKYTTLDSSASYWDAQIDDVRVYDKALTSTEVTNLYETGHING